MLWKRFEKSRFISRKEAEDLARVLNVFPEKIVDWFRDKRHIGGLRALERNAEGRHFLRYLIEWVLFDAHSYKMLSGLIA